MVITWQKIIIENHIWPPLLFSFMVLFLSKKQNSAEGTSGKSKGKKSSELILSNCLELELANDEDWMQWQGLKSLLSFEFSRLSKLVSLPLGLQHATTLQNLRISNCENLTAIPEWIHNCTSLQVLEIEEYSSLTSLPEGMRSLTSLERLKIKDCPLLLQRCERKVGEDWPKIAHIPELELQHPPQPRENSNTHASSTDLEVAEPIEGQKKQRISSIFKKSRALNS